MAFLNRVAGEGPVRCAGKVANPSYSITAEERLLLTDARRSEAAGAPHRSNRCSG